MRARPGDRLSHDSPPTLTRKAQSWATNGNSPQGVRRILIIADETALPAAAGILETLDDLPLKPKVEALFEAPRGDDVQPLPQATKMRWLASDSEPGSQHGELLMRALRDIDLHKEIQALGGTPTNTTTNDASDDEDGPLWEPATLDDSAPFYAWIAAETKVAMKSASLFGQRVRATQAYVTSTWLRARARPMVKGTANNTALNSDITSKPAQTPIGWRDSPNCYGRVSRALHWLTATLVTLQFTVLLAWRGMGENVITLFLASIGPHGSLGFMILIVTLIRLGWAWINRKQRPPHTPALGGRLARFVHITFYGLLMWLPAFAILRRVRPRRGATLLSHGAAAEAERDITWTIARSRAPSRPALVAFMWISHRPHSNGTGSPFLVQGQGIGADWWGKWQVKVWIRILRLCSCKR